MHVKEEKRVEQYICSARDNALSRVHDQRVKEQIYNSSKIREKNENVCWQQKQWRF
jgi:hypothetical protein